MPTPAQRARDRPRGDVSDRPRVLVRERIAEAGVELLRDRFDVDVDLDGALEERIGAYDGLIVRSATKVTADLLEQAVRLRVIGRAGVGVDNVDVDAATKRGILVVNAPESTVVSAAEHAIGLLLALARSIPQAHAALKDGRWERSRFAGIELAEKTLGVVGFGRIGQQVARRARGLAMHVVAYDPFVAPERMREAGVEHVASLEGLLEVSDFVTLHTALTAESRNLIGARELELAQGRSPHRQRGTGRARGRGGAHRGAALGACRRCGARHLRAGAVLRAAARARQRRPDSPSRRLDPGGTGSGRRDRRGAGRRGPRGTARVERRQRSGDRPRGARVPRALPAARREARRARVRARRRRPSSGSSSPTTASSPSTTPVCSPSPR